MADVTIELELETPNAHKLWRAERSGSVVVTESGAVGKKTRASKKDHGSEDKAIKSLATAIAKKHKEGYFPRGTTELPPQVEADASQVERVDQLRVHPLPNVSDQRRMRRYEDEDGGRPPMLVDRPPPQLEQHGKKYGFRFLDVPGGHNLYAGSDAVYLGRRHFIRKLQPELEGNAEVKVHGLRPDAKAFLLAHDRAIYQVDLDSAAAGEVIRFESVAERRRKRCWMYDREGARILYVDGTNLVSITPAGKDARPTADLGAEAIVSAVPIHGGRIAVLQPSRLTVLEPDGERYRATHRMSLREGQALGTWLGGRGLIVMTSNRSDRTTVSFAVHDDGLRELQSSARELVAAFEARGACWIMEAAPGGRVPWRAYQVFNVERAWQAARAHPPLPERHVIAEVPLHDAIAKAVADKLGPSYVRAAYEEGAKLEHRAYNAGTTALGYAVWRGDADIVELVLELGADVNGISYEGRSPLAQAYEAGRIDLAERLLQAGASPAVFPSVTIDGHEIRTEAPIVAAARQGYEEQVLLLLERGAEVDALGHDGSTALTAAARGRFEDLALMLLERGASADAVVDGGPAPIDAAQRGRCNRLMKALADKSERDIKGPVGAAALRGALLGLSVDEPVAEMVDALLAGGARDTGAEAMHRAIDAGHAGAVMAFLEAGADPNAPYVTANAPAEHLHYAVWRAEPVEEIVNALLDAGAALDVNDHRGFTPIRYGAANHKDVRFVKRLIERGAKLSRGEGQWNALHQATRAGNVEMMQLLLEAGSDIDETTVHGLTALEIAVYNDKPEALRWLLDQGADVNAGGFTPLMSAAVKNEVELVELLLERGADPNKRAANPYIQDTTERTAQQHAETAGAMEAAALIGERAGTGHASLFGATLADDLKGLAEMLGAGADPNAPHGPQGLTPLHVAKSARAIALLVEHGADVNRPAKTGHTPLASQAAAEAAGDTVPALLAHGADARSSTALFAAAARGDVDVARALIDAGAPLKLAAQQQTPLHSAVEGNHPEMVELLLERGADPNAFDAGGIDGLRAPLHLAAIHNRVEVARILLAHGADATRDDEDHENYEWGCFTPVHWAAYHGSFEVLCELLRHAPRAIHYDNARGQLPIDLADDHPRCAELMRAVGREGLTLDAFLAGAGDARAACETAAREGSLWIERSDEQIGDRTGVAPAKVREQLGPHDWVRTTRREKSLVLRFDKGPYRAALGDGSGIVELDVLIRSQAMPYDMHVSGERFLVSDNRAVFELDGLAHSAVKLLEAAAVQEVGYLDEGRLVVVTKKEVQAYRREPTGVKLEWSLPRAGLAEIFPTSSRVVGIKLDANVLETLWASFDDDGVRWLGAWDKPVVRFWCHDADGAHVGIAYTRVYDPEVFLVHNLPSARAAGDTVSRFARPKEMAAVPVRA